MATNRRLGDGWTLTDGVREPFLLPHPTDVASALREQGWLEKAPSGTRLMHEEWMYLRTFTYACSFVLPEEDDEIAALHFSGLAGHGFILLNGDIIHAFHDAPAHIPITCCGLREGENLLEVRFSPPCERTLFGIVGDVFLRTTNYLTLVCSRFIGASNKIIAETALEAFSAGKYLFKYTVSLDGQVVRNEEFVERLKAISRAKLTHELPIPNPVPWDAGSPDDSCYSVRLSIERMGIGCELVRADVALLPDGYTPKRIVRLPRGAADERALRRIAELGAEAVAVDMGADPDSGEPRLFCPNFLRYGLLTVDAADVEPLPVERAILPMETLTALAGDLPFWPGDAPLWKLLGAAPPDAAAYESRFGVNATGDARRCIAHSRTLQAEQIAVAAQAKIRSGEPILIERLVDSIPTPMSDALLDPNYEKRPAFDALKAAWALQ